MPVYEHLLGVLSVHIFPASVTVVRISFLISSLAHLVLTATFQFQRTIFSSTLSCILSLRELFLLPCTT